jgi:isopenicillin-N epimerase
MLKNGMKNERDYSNPSGLIGVSLGLARFWSLDSNILFLNHGSFGACPVPVLAVQQEWRDRLERQPLQFLDREIESLLDEVRTELSAFVGANPDDLALMPNATTGVNTVLRSLRFQSGDELLTTNQEYNACRNALDYVAEREGVQVVVAEVPFPLDAPEQVIETVLQKVSPHTRLVLLDHVTSQTGLVFPIAEIIRELNQRGIETLIDGAHAVGMLPLNLGELGATYYAGNCHKWLCAPKGSAFLYVQRDRQAKIRPLTISHGANSPRCDRSRFRLEFDWMGTSDPSAHLSVPAAIRFMGSLLPGGWPELMIANRSLVLAARQILCQALQVEPPCPDSMIGSLAGVPLPNGDCQALRDRLLQDYSIEVPIIPWEPPTGRLVRISAQCYNTLEQYAALAKALREIGLTQK